MFPPTAVLVMLAAPTLFVMSVSICALTDEAVGCATKQYDTSSSNIMYDFFILVFFLFVNSCVLFDYGIMGAFMGFHQLLFNTHYSNIFLLRS
jgi:hypothetical protein